MPGLDEWRQAETGWQQPVSPDSTAIATSVWSIFGVLAGHDA
jgi:hypothetical protein